MAVIYDNKDLCGDFWEITEGSPFHTHNLAIGHSECMARGTRRIIRMGDKTNSHGESWPI